MAKINWNGLMRVLEVRQEDAAGKLIWQKSDIGNLLHYAGEEFLLNVLFSGGASSNMFIPPFYYLGLDNRSSLSMDDTMQALVGEPTTNGYGRQAISSTRGFAVGMSAGGRYQATSPTVTFRAAGGGWGPVANIFLTDRSDRSGTLIASANLGNPFAVADGNTVTVRLGMSLRGCDVASD